MKESIPRSKAVRARAAAAQVRVGKQAITSTLPPRGKLEDAMATVAAVGESECPYAVQVDNQGVAYLRTALTAKGAQFIVNTGPEVQVVEFDNASIRSRGFRTVPEASVTEAVQILSRPLTKSVIISKRAKAALDVILNDKEFITMATATKAAKKAAKKSSVAAKTGKSNAKTTGASKGAGVGRFAGKSIKVLNKEHSAREGTKRAKAMELLFKCKTVDEAAPQLVKIGADNSFIRFAVDSKLIELV